MKRDDRSGDAISADRVPPLNGRAGLRPGNLLDEAYREHGSGIDRPGRHAGLWIDGVF